MKRATTILIIILSLSTCATESIQIPGEVSGMEKELWNIIEEYKLETLQFTYKDKDANPVNYTVGQQKDGSISNDHKYVIGSATKLFTSVLIMKLVEDEIISLDDKISSYLPVFNNHEDILIKHCLGNTSGIKDIVGFLNLIFKIGGFKGNRAIELDEIIERIAKSKPRFEPGSRFQYSTSNFIILGAILESVYAKPLTQIYEEQIFKPLGMNNTLFYVERSRKDLKLVEGKDYDYLPFGNRSFGIEQVGWYSLLSGGGAIISTSEDMTLWMDALFKGEIISEITLKMMMNYRTDVDRMKNIMTGYGYGLSEFTLSGEKWLGHAGGMMGYQCLPLYNPQKGRIIVLHFNESRNPGDYYYEIFLRLNTYIDQY